ncbi:AraC family transcriptional regulator [Pedobacter foliorum]|uniref:helix-turn-helix domain-containing protein n=1 Tax=Pedobacter foliorum TaxID=2739058 RepID=UPI00156513DF|nr:AraC family transcriptional regulator [Pedobacter foliorum]NRF40164.1 AraC family transcriptional regulator [Pedobacter foliorum]
MKPLHEKLILEPKNSFVLQKDIYPYYPTPWHYHPEYELVLVVKSSGMRTVGDHNEHFTDGDLVFLGPNLPHSYQNDAIYYRDDSSLKAEAIVIHFKEDFLGKDFFNLPEMIQVVQLFNKAKYGIKITGNTRQQISDIMLQMHTVTGHKKILQLLSILEILSNSDEIELLSNPGFVQQHLVSDDDRITKVHEYIMKNFQKDISLSEVAEIANMSIPSFCRLFKSSTRKAFSNFVNEIRVGHACRLLLEDRESIAQICYKSGFNNMSNFNRQFKRLKERSPLQYRQSVSR